MNQKGGSKTDMIVKLALVFFISLFAFSVGTFVGKSVSEAERRNAALNEEESNVRDLASIDPKALDVEPENALTDKEVAQLTKEFISEEEGSHREVASNDAHAKKDDGHGKKDAHAKKDDGHGGGHEVAKTKHTETTDKDGYKKVVRKEDAHGKKDAHAPKKDEHKEKTSSHKKTSGKVSKAAKRVLHGKSPAAEHKRKPSAIAKKLPIVPKAAVGKYTVQVSAYATKTEAKAHEKQLDSHGYEAFVIKAKVKGKTWYCVNIGAFHSLKNAKNFKSTFLKENANQAAIVKKVVR